MTNTTQYDLPMVKCSGRGDVAQEKEGVIVNTHHRNAVLTPTGYPDKKLHSKARSFHVA